MSARGLTGGSDLPGQGADSSSVWAPLALTLVLITLLLGAVEVARRRRLLRRSG